MVILAMNDKVGTLLQSAVFEQISELSADGLHLYDDLLNQWKDQVQQQTSGLNGDCFNSKCQKQTDFGLKSSEV